MQANYRCIQILLVQNQNCIMMSCLSVNRDFIVIGSDYLVDLFNISSNKHVVLHLPPYNSTPGNCSEQDFVADINISPDGAHFAVMTGPSKRLFIYDFAYLETPTILNLPRAASRARFTPDSMHVLVADKTGDALFYDIKDPANTEVKLFGHLSLLLDILMTTDSNYIITSDRDEKIRVSHYPNSYNIKSYCLGHKQFIKHIEMLPNDQKYLISASGDGSVKVWDYIDGRLCHTIETGDYIQDKQCLDSFIEVMDKDGVEVNKLPIILMSTVKFDEHSSLLAVSVLNCKKILVFQIHFKDKQFEHKLFHTISLEKIPSAFQFDNGKLYICIDGEDIKVQAYKVPEVENEPFTQLSTYDMFMGENITKAKKEVDVNLLYKRKFDNVQEYQERKRQRLERNGEK